MNRYGIITCFYLFSIAGVSGQDHNNYFRVNYQLSTKVTDDLRLNLIAEPEYGFAEEGLSQIDLLAGLALNRGDLQWAAAFVYREVIVGANALEWRPWQQVTHSFNINAWRIRNRFRVEERFQRNRTSTTAREKIRLRYRISGDVPLQGERLDVGELYLNSSIEGVWDDAFRASSHRREIRTYLGIGFQLRQNFRLEGAMDFRYGRNKQAEDTNSELIFRLTMVQKVVDKSST